MSNIKEMIIRNRLAATVSALAMASALAMPAAAQTYQTTTGFQTVTINPTFASQYSTFEVTSGTKAVIVASWAQQSWAVGSNTAVTIASPGGSANISHLNPCANGSLAYSATSCLNGGPLLQVDAGGTLVVGGIQTNSSMVGGTGFESDIHADGNVVIEYAGPTQSWGTPTQQFIGTNVFLGNISLSDSPVLSANQVTATFGLSWAKAFTQFGPNTNIHLGNNTILAIWQDASTPLVMGGALSGTGTLNLSSGTLVINGANTAANPFTGTLAISPTMVVVVGDGSHPGAVLGDPGNPTAHQLNLTGTSAGAPILRGLGTVDAVVVNTFATVQPGYGSTLGTLTVAGYKQDATGTLKVEISPNANSGLHVLGNATLGGTLSITIDPGTYTTKSYDFLTVDGTTTGSFSSIVTQSSVSGAAAVMIKDAKGYHVVTEVMQGKAAAAPVVVGHLVSANRLNNGFLIASLYDRIAEGSPRGAEQVGPNKYVWIQGFGRLSSVSRNDIGYHTSTEGFTAGAEYRTEDNKVVGVAASYSVEDLKTKGTSTASIDTWHIAAYGGANVQYMRLDGALFYNGYSTDVQRNLGTTGTAKVKPDGYAYGGSIQASLPLYRGLVTPYIRGIVSRQHLDGSLEAGASVLDLHYAAINLNAFVGDFGFRINPLRSYPENKTKLLITVAVEHDFSALGETVAGSFALDDTQAWSSYWRGDSENTAIAGLDFARKITDKLEVTGRVNGRFSLYQTAGEVSLGAKYRF